MKDQQWEVAHDIASELVARDTDPNELGKVMSFVRQHRNDLDLKQKLMRLLEQMVRQRNTFRRSRQTQRYLQNIQSACRFHLRNLDVPEELLLILGWSLRLMRYYKIEPKRAAERHRANSAKRPPSEQRRQRPADRETVREQHVRPATGRLKKDAHQSEGHGKDSQTPRQIERQRRQRPLESREIPTHERSRSGHIGRSSDSTRPPARRQRPSTRRAEQPVNLEMLRATQSLGSMIESQQPASEKPSTRQIRIGQRVPATVQNNDNRLVTVKLHAGLGGEMSFERPYYPGQAGEEVKVKVMELDEEGKITKVLPG